MKLNKINLEYAKILFESIYKIDNNDQDVSFNFQNQTIAIVPGSFKPPHKGHWEMIMNFVNMKNVNKVIVLISNISTKAISNRPLSLSNLKQFGKIKQFAFDNDILNERIENIFNEIESKIEELNFESLKEYLNDLLNESKNVKKNEIKYVKKFQILINVYLNKLNDTLFKSIRKAGDFEITPEVSKQIFEIFAKAYNVENIVDIRISNSASPITDTLSFVNYDCDNCIILLGVSKKGNDQNRWNNIDKSIKNETNKVIPYPVSVQTMISATDLRNNISNLKKEYFPDKISNKDFEDIKNILK